MEIIITATDIALGLTIAYLLTVVLGLFFLAMSQLAFNLSRELETIECDITRIGLQIILSPIAILGLPGVAILNSIDNVN